MRWPLPRGTPASPTARTHIATATECLDPELAYAAGSLTSEVVTAALMREGTDDMRLEVAVSRLNLYVDVTASFPWHGAPLVPAQGAGSRGGMMIVDALANDWGVLEESGSGTGSLCIWFRLKLSR